MICFSLPSWLQLFQAHFLLPCQAFQGWGAGRAKTFTLHRQASPAGLDTGSHPAPTASACPESRRSFLRGTDLHLLEEPLRDPVCHPVREKDWAYFSFSHHSASPVGTQHLFTVTVPHPLSFQSVLEQRLRSRSAPEGAIGSDIPPSQMASQPSGTCVWNECGRADSQPQLTESVNLFEWRDGTVSWSCHLFTPGAPNTLQRATVC